MWHDGPAKAMTSHVRRIVWGLGRAEQGQPHHISDCGEAVFTVVKDGDAVFVLRKVRKFMTADLEFGHIPSEGAVSSYGQGVREVRIAYDVL